MKKIIVLIVCLITFAVSVFAISSVVNKDPQSMLVNVTPDERLEIWSEVEISIENEVGLKLIFCNMADMVLIKNLSNKELIDAKIWIYKNYQRHYFTVVIKEHEGWYELKKVLEF